MRDLSENMRSPSFRLFALGAAVLLALALGAWRGQWLEALGLATAAAALAASWDGLLGLLGLGGSARKDDLRAELAEVGKVAHDAAEDLTQMEEILEELVNENRRALAEHATTANQLKNRLLSLDSAEKDDGSHQRLAALEARLEAADEAIAGLRVLAERRLAHPEPAPAPVVQTAPPASQFQTSQLQAEPPARSDPSAGFLADVAAGSARRRSEPTPPPEPIPAPEPPRPASPSRPGGGSSMGDLAETLRHRAREAQQARREASAPRPAPRPGESPAAQVAQVYAEPEIGASGGIAASLTPLASLAAMAGNAPSQLQQAAPRPQPPPAQAGRPAQASAPPQQRGGGGSRPGGQGGQQGGGRPASGGPGPGESQPIYALAPRVVAGHQLGVAEGASVSERLSLAASKAAELAAAGVEEGVHLPLRAAHLAGAGASEIEAALRGNPDLGRRLVMVVPVGDLEAMAVEPLDALRAHGAALRADVPSPDGLSAEHFSRLKVELASAPGLLALAMAPHAMQMGMALMASDVAEPVMLQALSIAGIPLVSGPATELLAQAGPAPMQAQP